MKLIYKDVFTLSTKLVIIGLLTLGTLSCSKDNKSEEAIATVSSGETVITFTVVDIKDVTVNTVASAAVKSKDTKGKTTFFQTDKGDFDAFLEVSSGPFTKSNQNTSVPRASTSNPKAAVMPTTSKYRILLYNEQNTVLKKEIEIQSGASPQLTVDAGVKYNWYAVSTNEDTAPTVSNGVISKSALSNKDVLYAKGTITPQFGMDNRIPITFQHLNVAYSVNLDTRGAFSSINNSTQMVFPGSNATLYTGDLNLFNGSYVNETAINVNSLTSNMTTTIISPATNRPVVKNVVFYSSKGQTFTGNSFSVGFSTLNLTFDDGSGSTVSNTTNRIFTFSQGFTSTPGNQYNINVQLIQGGGIIKDKIIWAPTNLVYIPGQVGSAAYRFRKNNAYATTDVNELWKWNALTPDGPSIVTINEFIDGDPCKKVFPERQWRLPTPAEFNINQPNELFAENKPDPGIFGAFISIMSSRAYKAWQWRFGRSETTRSEMNLSNPKTLILPLNGFMNPSGNMEGVPQTLAVGLFSDYGVGNYWTSTQGTYQSLVYNTLFVFLGSGATFKTETGNIANRFSIRCVRDRP